jgi:hypothetical protein
MGPLFLEGQLQNGFETDDGRGSDEILITIIDRF